MKHGRPLRDLCEEMMTGLFRYALTNTDYVEDDAWEVVQGVFAKLLSDEGTYLKVTGLPDEKSQRKYIVRMVHNDCMNMHRARTAAPKNIDDLPEDQVAEESAERRVLFLVELDRMRGAVELLPEKYRSYIHMKYYMELENGEIARALGVRPDTLRTLNMRAIQKLRRLLGEEERHELEK